MYRPASLPQALDSTKVHSCINIYNFREQICDRYASSKSCLRKTIRHLEKTISFVIFSKCFVVFPKYHLRVPSDPCRMTINYEKAPEQACVCRKSAPVQCKDNTFFAKIQIADFRVNISNTPRTRLAQEALLRPWRHTPAPSLFFFFWGQGSSLPFRLLARKYRPTLATPPPLPPCSPAEACPPVPPPVPPP